MLARLQQLQARVTQFGELAGRLAAAAPQQADGSDPSGWVRVTLGADGLPTAIKVRDGWGRRIEAAGLGAAVIAANADGIRQGMRAFSDRLDDARWWAQRTRLDADGPDPPAGAVPPSASTVRPSASAVPPPASAVRPSASAVPPPAGEVPLPAGRERDPGELTEDILRALHSARRAPEAAAGTREGSDSQRHVTVTLGPSGLTGCAIDAGWAARQEGDAITAALAQALRAARPARPAPPTPGVELDGLLGDALATLRAITDQRPAPGGAS